MKHIYICALLSFFCWGLYAEAYDIDLFNERCREFDLELVAVQKDDEVEAYSSYRGINFVVPKQLFEKLYHEVMQHDPFNKIVASIRSFDSGTISPGEKIASVNRDIACKAALEKILNMSIDIKKMPRIAVCCSGGGIRALVSSAGFLNGFAKNGFLDFVHTICALSGSTWPLAAWMQSGKSFADFYSILLDRLVKGFFNTTSKEAVEELMMSVPELTEYFIKKFIFKEVPTIIDFYGYCLALNLTDQSKMGNYTQDSLAYQQQMVDAGKFPIPVYTSIIPDKNGNHSWVTFSPYEVGCLDLESGVPSRFFGREFNKGVSVNNAPALPLGFLMGVWGSAISISFKELYNMMLSKLKPETLFEPLKLLAKETVMGDLRFFPAYIHNYTYGSKDLPMSQNQQNILIDAGIACNIPVVPLLNADRGIDIIIILDASGDILGAPELKIAEKYARNHKLPFPKIDYSSINKQPYSIFDDGAGVPVVLYIPMIKNNSYDSSFDPQNYLGTFGFMNTFNFDYSKKEAEQLAGLFEYAAKQIQNDLIKVIKTVMNRK